MAFKVMKLGEFFTEKVKRKSEKCPDRAQWSTKHLVVVHSRSSS